MPGFMYYLMVLTVLASNVMMKSE